MNMSLLVNHVAMYVISLFKKHTDVKCTFHNLQYTTYIVEKTNIIGIESGLSPLEIETVLIAAWFSNSGYCFSYQGYQRKSIVTATNYLRSISCESPFIETVCNLIKATNTGSLPENLLEKVLCDARNAYFGSTDYAKYLFRLRIEYQNCLNKTYFNEEWLGYNIRRFLDCQYYTTAGQNLFNQQKLKNIFEMIETINEPFLNNTL